MIPWNERFFGSTRGQIIRLLRRGSHTVGELARRLDLTENAVRAHMAMLERDGLVQQRPLRRGRGKPVASYNLTPEAHALFPNAYEEVLQEVLGQAAARHGRAEVEAVLRAAGRSLATALGREPAGETLEDRLEAVTGVLGDLGGLVEVRRENDGFVLEGYVCPLRGIVTDYPEACQLALALVQSLLGETAVSESCNRGVEPHCRIEVASRPDQQLDAKGT